MPEILPPKVTPDAFSLGLEGNLEARLVAFGIGEQQVKIREAEKPYEELRNIYTVNVSERESFTLVHLQISQMAREMGGKIFQGIESADGRTLILTLGAGRTPTDIVVLRKIRGLPVRKARMAVIIDDLGVRSIEYARRLCELEQEVTLAVLPFQRYTGDIVELARETGTPYMLHMPMEPGNPGVNPGEGALFISDSAHLITEKLSRAFRSVDGARGMNNHMGSKATQDIRTMEVVMTHLRENRCFFVDSQTSRASKGYSLSQKMGVKSAVLTRYLDVEDDEDFIEKRIDELAATAFDTGLVVVIGHDRPKTIAVLERKLPELAARGIAFVPVADVVR